MNDIPNLKANLAATAARYRAQLERDIQKLTALARLVDAEQTLHELEESRHEA